MRALPLGRHLLGVGHPPPDPAPSNKCVVCVNTCVPDHDSSSKSSTDSDSISDHGRDSDYVLDDDDSSSSADTPPTAARAAGRKRGRVRRVVGWLDDSGHTGPDPQVNKEDDPESDDVAAPERSEDMPKQLMNSDGSSAKTGVYYMPCPETKVYDTTNACFFCKKDVKQKMKRHLMTAHKNEPRVIQALGKPTLKEQNHEFKRLLNEGNFQRNLAVLKCGRGQLILRRRPKTAGIPISRFHPCPGCLGFMLATNLEEHAATCEFVSEEWLQSVDVRSELLLGAFRDGPTPKAILKIQNKDIQNLVRQDPTLVAYAKYMGQSKRKAKHHEKILKASLTRLARLLKGVRASVGEPNLTVKELCSPLLFETIISVTHEMGEYNEETSEENSCYSTSRHPRIVRQTLGNIAHVLQGEAIREGDEAEEKKIADFRRLLKDEWGDKMSRASLHTLNVRKQKQDDVTPSTENMKA